MGVCHSILGPLVKYIDLIIKNIIVITATDPNEMNLIATSHSIIIHLLILGGWLILVHLICTNKLNHHKHPLTYNPYPDNIVLV